MKISRSSCLAIFWGILCALIATMYFALAAESDRREYELYHSIAQELADCNAEAQLENNTTVVDTQNAASDENIAYETISSEDNAPADIIQSSYFDTP